MRRLTKTDLRKFQTTGLIALAAALLAACGQKSDINSLNNYSGRDDQSIVNGRAVTASDIAAQSTVALYLPTANGVVNFCTGTLIKENYILTAAHCIGDLAVKLDVEPERLARAIRVGFGTEVTSNLLDPQVSFVGVEEVHIHPLYKVDTVKTAMEEPMFDMAIFKLRANAPSHYTPVQILRDSAVLQPGTRLLLAGFGLTNGVQQTSAERMMQVEVRIAVPNMTEAQFAYLVEDGRSACSGDSGGPAFYVDNDNKVSLAGVTSWGDETCEQVGAYTSVPAVQGWITSTVGL